MGQPKDFNDYANSEEPMSAVNSLTQSPGQHQRESIMSPDSPEAQRQVDQLIAHVNEKIELLDFDSPAPSLLRQMVQSLVDPRRATRLNLVESLSQIGEPATPFLLEGLAQHHDAVVRRACCNALTRIGDATSVTGLVQALLKDEDIGVKSAAAGALAKVGAPAFSEIREVLAADDVSESSKGHAAWALASMSGEVSEQLYRIMSDPSPAVRTAVVGAIAQLAQTQMAQQSPDQKPSAQTLSASGEQPERAVSLPVSMRPSEQAQNTLSLLTEALNDSSPEVRIEAAANLARLKCQKAYQPIVACLKDPISDVRKAAILALGKLGNPEAIDSIAPLERDLEADVQRMASLVIAQLEALRSQSP